MRLISPAGWLNEKWFFAPRWGLVLHGTAISGQDDRDEMGICLEPPHFGTGLARVPKGIAGPKPSVPFEQYERHGVGQARGGVANDRGPATSMSSPTPPWP